MTTAIQQDEFLSRGIDYLGDLGAKLRDLQGFATLAHELIQNADDASGTGWISFDVCEHALVVDNDGTFSECGNVKAPECPWKRDPARGYLCDFHGFRSVASGHKRERPGTTGAFGIGFISVYQITDRPELISAGRHWILQEDRSENERIKVCHGCEDCRDARLPKTRFILPWVRDPETALRQALRAPALSEEDPPRLLEELKRSLPAAMIFLKQLRSADVKQEGRVELRLERVVDKDSLIISDGKSDRIWHLFRGNFNDAAAELRRQHGNRIEAKRSANVTLAIPAEPLEKGIFCACLPTEQETGLPFHLNADFYPSNDRKRIILEADYQSAWNRAAIGAAAVVLKAALPRLPALLGHKHLWHAFQQLQHVAEEAASGHREKSLALCWQQLLPELRRASIFFTSSGEWESAPRVLMFLSEEEEEVTPILESLGMSLIHTDLRPFFNLFRSNTVGVQLVDVPPIALALENAGLGRPTKMSALPACLSTEKGRRQLRRELALLLGRRRKSSEQYDVERRLKQCAILPGRDGTLWPCGQLFQADADTAALFTEIDPGIPFLGELEEGTDVLRALCPEFTPAAAVDRLRHALDAAADAGRALPLDPLRLLRWFESRRDMILYSSEVKRALTALPIFPSSQGLKPLTVLALTGNFTDPIGLADVVDLDRLGGRREFLKDLDAKELTFVRYAAHHVPPAFRNPDISPEQKRKAIRLLAERLGEIFEHDEVRAALAAALVVECEDGLFRRPAQVYFDSEAVRLVLGDEVHRAAFPEGHQAGIAELYRWLGVTEHPRYEAIARRVQTLVSTPPNEQLVEAVGTIFRHLGGRVHRADQDTDALLTLRTLAWLPASGDRQRWYQPTDLYAVFQNYLFATQARFLDLPREAQTASSELLEFLMVKTTPGPAQVVAHLLKCAETNVPVNKEVYRYLNDKAQDPSLLQLRDKACLPLSDNAYVKPSQVFWGEHPFGRFRHRLAPDLRQYGELFTTLGVREGPDHRDARLVLGEIAVEYGTAKKILDDKAYAVLLACWRRLEQALEGGQVTPEELAGLGKARVIPDDRHVLNPPGWIFFEDRAGLAAKFKGFLDHNVIARPQGAWRAMSEAGVQALGSAVRSHIVECTNPVDDELVAHRLRERRRQLARVLESQEGGNGHGDVAILEQLRPQSVAELKIHYSLNAFGRQLTSDAEKVPAHFQAEQQVLYFVRREGQVPWASLARELALALCPDADPGRLAAGLKEVLSAESEQSAAETLDELGFAPLDLAPQENVGGGAVIESLGREVTDGAGIPPRPAVNSPADTPPADQEQPLSPQAAVEQILGPGGATTTPMPPELSELPQQPPSQAGGRSRPPTGKTGHKQPGSGRQSQHDNEVRTRARVQVKLRTYVSSGGSEPEDPQRVVERDAVERAGVDRVMAYERQQHRKPTEMPPKNPGFDVKSENQGGEVERYIEVKSLSGDWEYSNAGVSDTQFQLAVELGDRYWLYVVERAEQPSFRIYRIQNPAGRADQFLFDDGWKALAEPDVEPGIATENARDGQQ